MIVVFCRNGMLRCLVTLPMIGAVIALPTAYGHAQTAQSTPRPLLTPRPTFTPEAQTQNQGLRDAGRTAETGSGRVGQRQSAREVARSISPLGRVQNRVQNRVQSRIANRIDENYDPVANARSPFETAEERARAASRNPRN